MNELIVVDNTTGEVVGLPDNTSEIVSLPSRVTWDVREKFPIFRTDQGESQTLEGDFMVASFIYACWTDQVGQPTCMGSGKFCPEHPDTSEMGIGLLLNTLEFGVIYMSCFGLMKNWAQGLVKRASKNEGMFKAEGTKGINTKHGSMQIPGLAK